MAEKKFKFRLLPKTGGHTEDGRTYLSKDREVIETHRELDKLFKNKFERLDSSADSKASQEERRAADARTTQITPYDTSDTERHPPAGALQPSEPDESEWAGGDDDSSEDEPKLTAKERRAKAAKSRK